MFQQTQTVMTSGYQGVATVVVAPGMQRVYDYGSRTDGQPEYEGLAPMGASESSALWSVWKHTYDAGTGFIMKTETSEGTWTGRASLF